MRKIGYRIWNKKIHERAKLRDLVHSYGHLLIDYRNVFIGLGITPLVNDVTESFYEPNKYL